MSSCCFLPLLGLVLLALRNQEVCCDGTVRTHAVKLTLLVCCLCAAPDQFLVLSTSDSKLEFAYVDRDPSESVSGMSPLVNVSASRLDYDASNQNIFWTDEMNDAIKVDGIQGGRRRDLLKGFTDVTAVAVDWVSNLLYFSDKTTEIVGVGSLDGQYSVIIAEGVEVTYLALDSEAG